MNRVDADLPTNDWNKMEANGSCEDPKVTAARRLSKRSGTRWPVISGGIFRLRACPSPLTLPSFLSGWDILAASLQLNKRFHRPISWGTALLGMSVALLA